jgi:aryl-alcohol dehydrogenase-like predicted oxidoreductase
MRFRTLGRTGLSVSEISLGTVEIGMDYGIAKNGTAHRPDEDQAALLLHRALDLGVNLIDTARAYGQSEEIIGRVLSSRRKEFMVCSKVLARQHEELSPTERRRHVIESLDNSLRLLRTDVIDIFMIHSAAFDVIQDGEMADILNDLRSSGKFRWTGASVYGDDSALAAIASGSFDCLQIAYSALDRRPEVGVLRAAEQADIGLIARSVLLKGALTPRYRDLPEALNELKSAVLTTVSLSDLALPELAYRYVLTGSLPHTALVGASSVGELESAVHYSENGPLPADLIERVRSINITDETLLNPGTWQVG